MLFIGNKQNFTHAWEKILTLIQIIDLFSGVHHKLNLSTFINSKSPLIYCLREWADFCPPQVYLKTLSLFINLIPDLVELNTINCYVCLLPLYCPPMHYLPTRSHPWIFWSSELSHPTLVTTILHYTQNFHVFF